MANKVTLERCLFCREEFPVEWEGDTPRVLRLCACQGTQMRERADAIECVQATEKILRDFENGKAVCGSFEDLLRQCQEVLQSI